MPNDLLLNLPQGIELKQLDIVPEFNNYSELLQRVVVLCLLNESINLTTDDYYLCELIQQATTGSLPGLIKQLIPVADRIKMVINAEEEEDVLASVQFELEKLSERSFKLYINIVKTDDTIEEGSFLVNG